MSIDEVLVADFKNLDLNNITELDLSNKGITSLVGINKLQRSKIYSLNLSNNKLEYIYEIDAMRGLRTLKLNGNPIKSLRGIEHLSYLVDFECSISTLSSDELSHNTGGLKELQNYLFSIGNWECKVSLLIRQESLKKQLIECETKLDFLAKSKMENFSEKQFKIYQTLQTIKEDMSDVEKSRIIAKLL